MVATLVLEKRVVLARKYRVTPFFNEAGETCKDGGRNTVTEHVTAKVDRFFQEKIPIENENGQLN